nr:MBG domain-containing protein [Niveispirillum sp. BGYR6]
MLLSGVSALALQAQAQQAPAVAPTGASVVSGRVGIETNGAQTIINQSSDRALVNWSRFDTAAGQHVQVNQPGSTSLLVNRVTGGAATRFDGTLSANGQVFLLNEAGIFFGSTAQINAAGFLASTGRLDEQSFLAGGTVRIELADSLSRIVNQGVIRVAEGGYAALAAGIVQNKGVVEARLGHVVLSGAESFTLDLAGDGLLSFAVPAGSAAGQVLNQGHLGADGGTVLLTARGGRDAMAGVINSSGSIQAQTVQERGGRIIIAGDDGVSVELSGRVDASAASGQGGGISVDGGAIALTGANLSADGASGGGSVSIGGSPKADRLAQTVAMDAASQISADAKAQGDGGRITLWSRKTTEAEGAISAQGGTAGGDGGFVEVSSKGGVRLTGALSLGALAGKGGTLLLDPTDIIIDDLADLSGVGAADLGVSVESLAASSASIVYLEADNNIIIRDLAAGGVTMLPNVSLSLKAGLDSGAAEGSIKFLTSGTQLTTSGSGRITLDARGNIDGAFKLTSGAGDIVVAAGGTMRLTGADIRTSSGDITLVAGHRSGGQGAIVLTDTNIHADHGWVILSGGPGLDTTSLLEIYSATGTASDAAGITLSNSSISIDQGEITLRGRGSDFGASGGNHGIAITNGSVLSAGDGYISLYGEASGTGGGSYGVLVSGAGTRLSITGSGGLSLRGTATNSVGRGQGDNSGIVIADGAALSVATGAMRLTGTGGTTDLAGPEDSDDGGNDGVRIQGAATRLTINGGRLVLNGTGGTAGTGSSGADSLGVVVDGAVIAGTTGAELTITADGDSGASADSHGEKGVGLWLGNGAVLGQAGSDATLSLELRDLAISGGAAILGAGTIAITTQDSGDSIGLGDGVTGSLHISAAEMAAISSSFTQRTVGHLEGSGELRVGDVALTGRTRLRMDGADGRIILSGAVNAGENSLSLNGGGISQTGSSVLTAGVLNADAVGSLSLTGANRISELGTIKAGSGVDIRSTSTLMVGDVDAGAGTLQLLADGVDLILGDAATLRNSGAGHDIILASTRDFKADDTASVTAGGRWLIYSRSAATADLGTLSGTVLRGRSYADHPPAGVTQSGNLVLYAASGTLTVTANGFTRAYGAANPAFTYTITGFEAGDTLDNTISGAALLGTSATAASGVGTYTITISQGTLANSKGYDFSYATGTLTINPAALVITANDASRTYGTANPAFTARYDGLVNGDTASVVSGLTLVTGATAASGVGSYAITGSGAMASNYTISYQAGALSITPAALIIQANDASRTYGAANPAFTARYDGLVNGDTASVVSGLTLATSATAASGVGSYAITGSGATAANYSISYQAGALSITPAALTIRANDTSRTYGAANPAFTARYDGLVNGDTASVVSGLTLATSATASSGVGSYAITGSGATAANYTISYQAGALSITPAALTIRANDASRTYGAANPAFTARYDGLVNGDTASVVSGLTLATSATASSGVGSYAITGAGATAANYSISYQAGALNITPAALTIRANDASRTYGAANPAFTARYDGLVNGDTASVVSGLTLATSATAASGVGSYAITGSGATAANYSISYQAGALSITPAALTIRANDASRTYGAANPAFTARYDGLVNGDTASVVSGLTLVTSSATASSGVGSYAITGSGATAANYAISYQAGALSITPAALTIRANDASRTYGAANPAFTARYDGLVNGDTASVVSGLTLATSATAASGVGSYAITGSGATAANYTISYQAGALNITPAALTIRANDASRSYGVANPAFTARYDGLVNGDTASVVSGLALATSATVASGVGSYAITGSGAMAANYTISYQAGALSITPAALTIRANDATRTYGAGNPAFTARYDGLVNGDTASVVSGLALATSATAASGVGSYAITGSGATAANYTISYQAGALSITPAALTIRANDTSRTYGAANPAFTARYDGLVNGDTASVVSGLALATSATAASGVGSYAITGSGATASNYTISYQAGALSITPAALTIRANDASRTYGAANPAFTARYDGLVNGDTALVVNGLTLATSATAASGVGSYAITGSGAMAANYTISYQAGALNITPAALTIRANDASRTYGAANPAFTARYDGLVNGDTASVVSGLALATSATAASGVGSYAITGSGATASNYTISYQAGALGITPAALAIRANDASRTYGAANPAFTARYDGLVNGDTALVVSGLTLATSATAASGVGSYAITGSGATAANYTISYQAGALSITPAALTIRANDASRTYGAANPAFTARYDGLVNGDTASVVSGLTLGTDATASSGVGSYAITGLGATAANYTISYQAGALSITPAALTIRANDASRTYGAANPAFTARYDGLVNGDTASVVSGLTLATSATAASGVGSYAITGSGATAANYSISYQAGALSITPAALTIRANDASRTYGAANPAFTARYDGLVNGDTASVVSGLTLVTGATASSGVGSYAITGSGATAANYTISYQAGALNITPAALTIRANDASRTYGAANPAFTARYDGLVNGDTASVVSGLTLATSATAASGVGSYAITGSGATAANYSISYQAGALSITPAALIIRANDASRTYGAANPAFTVRYEGLVNGDTASVVSGLTLATSATAASGVGSYAITGSGATAANYSISYQAGALSITPAALTIRANDASRTYGAANPAFTARYDGLVNGDTASVVSGLTLATGATAASGVGSYAITGSGATAANYSISYQAGALSITPAALTIRANDASRTYGAANPAFTARYDGLVNGDTASVVSGLTLATSATASSGVGSYAITGSGATAANYTISYQSGALSITPAALTIRANDASRTYGAANPAFTARYDGLVNGDTASVVSGLTLATGATAASGVGSYAITGSGATAANYSISYQAGALSITPAALTIRANDASRTYGASNPAFTARYDGLLNGDTASVVSGLTLSADATPASNVGAYRISLSGATAANYTISLQSGTLTVIPAALTIRVADASRVRGGANPAFTVIYDGFVNSDSAGIVSGLSVATPATSLSDLGSYRITASGAVAANYTIAYQEGTLTVTAPPAGQLPGPVASVVPVTQVNAISNVPPPLPSIANAGTPGGSTVAAVLQPGSPPASSPASNSSSGSESPPAAGGQPANRADAPADRVAEATAPAGSAPVSGSVNDRVTAPQVLIPGLLVRQNVPPPVPVTGTPGLDQNYPVMGQGW